MRHGQGFASMQHQIKLAVSVGTFEMEEETSFGCQRIATARQL
jgi:hypothetical protein